MTTNESFDALLADLTTQLARLEHELEMNTGILVSHGWVVTCGDLPLKLQLDGQVVVGCSPTWIVDATRLTKADAIAVARTAENGHGEKGEARPYVQELRKQIASHERTIERVRQMQVESAG